MHIAPLVGGTSVSARAYDIHTQAHVKPWTFSAFEDCFTKPYNAIVAIAESENSDAVLGFAILLTVVDEMTLMDIAVDQVVRGKGIGQALLNEVIAQASATNIAMLWLEVRASNHVAIDLYKKSGFKSIEVRKGYYDSNNGKEDAIIMCLNVNSL